MLRHVQQAAIASALLLCGAAGAQQAAEPLNISIYGLMDMAAGRFQDAGSPKASKAESGTMSNSYIGFKGKDDLGGGLKSVFALESFLRLDTGGAGRSAGEAFWARASYVGLQGAFGTTVLGRTTNLFYVSTLNFNAFGDSFGYSPSVRQMLAPAAGMLPFYGDIGWSNSIMYASPDSGGVTFNLQANLGESGAGATGKNSGANLIYRAGPLAATLAVQRVRNNNGNAFVPALPSGFSRQDSLQAGVSYDLNAVKLYGQFARIITQATQDTHTAIYGFGAAVPLGRGAVLAQYGHAVADFGSFERTNKTLSVGYDYLLSKNTDVYGVVMSDRLTGVDNGTTVAAGMRLRF